MGTNFQKRAWLYSAFRFLFEHFSHLDIQGLENVPAEGAAILAANHVGRLDSALAFCVLERQDATSLVADKYKKHPFFRWIVEASGAIWINREDADLQAMRAAREVLKKGGLLGIAPEGTRSPNAKMQQAKSGVAYLADKAGVPVIPMAIYGTENAFQQLFHFKRPTLHIHFSQPFNLPALDRKDREAGMLRNTDEIMCRIASLLPASYRGVYQDHPRLLELLEEDAARNKPQ